MIDHCAEHMILKPCMKCENKKLHQQVETLEKERDEWKQAALTVELDKRSLQEETERLRGCALYTQEAIKFYDSVLKATEDERMAVGSDHWDWLLKAARRTSETLNKQDKEN